MKIKILCTLGPASLNGDVIERLASRGVDLFRINLSHTPLEAVDEIIGLIERFTSVPICLDTEGPQVRCGPMEADVVVNREDRISLTAEMVSGTAHELTLWPAVIFDLLEPESVLTLDFDGAVVRIVDVEAGRAATAVVVSGGRVRSNKAITVTPAPELPALSEKDQAAIEVGRRRGISHYALSFASRGADVARLRALAPGAHVIAKIESRAGVRNMDSIIAAADTVLIDRGDLSREIPLESVPYYQKAIVRRANRWNRGVYVATNLLESMVTSRVPTIAEANDIANTLLDGVHGLVLAAETAVGADPVGSVDVVLRAIAAFERATARQLIHDDDSTQRQLAVEAAPR